MIRFSPFPPAIRCPVLPRCREIAVLALVAALWPAAAATEGAARFEGDWTIGDPSACVVGEDSPNFAFRIRGVVFEGLETRCAMTNPVNIRGMEAVLFDMECEGEGDRWTHRSFMMIDQSGALVIINDGFLSVISRCESGN